MNPLAKIKVICVDYGSVFEIELKDLYPLAKRFTQIPALAIRCSLANLEPADNKLNWSPDSIKKFHELVTYESIEELQIVKITEPGNFIVNLLNEDRISVSDILVEAGVANVMKPDPDLECFDGFDPLKEDFTSERNNYNLDVDDAGVAVTGYKSHNESYICKFYANNGECPRKRSCPYLHLQYSGDYTQDVEYFYTIVEQQIPSLNVRLVAQVSAMFSPGHFYIICPFGLEDVAKVTKSDLNSDDFYTQQDVLEFLHEDMNKFYKSHSSVFDNVTSDLSIGAVVACKYTDDCWYRAKVSAYTENEDVSVIYLDFGNQAIVSRCNIRELQPQFIHLPQQSYECYLNSVSPTKAGQNGWSEDSFEYFKSQIKNEFLIAKVVRTVNTVLYVDLYKSNVENGQPIRLNTMLVANGYAEAVLPCFTDIDYVDEDDDNCSSSQLGAYGPG